MKANEFWIARDEDNLLHLFTCKPIIYILRGSGMRCFTTSDKKEINIDYFLLNSELFPEITFENSPQKVRIELVKDN